MQITVSNCQCDSIHKCVSIDIQTPKGNNSLPGILLVHELLIVKKEWLVHVGEYAALI